MEPCSFEFTLPPSEKIRSFQFLEIKFYDHSMLNSTEKHRRGSVLIKLSGEYCSVQEASSREGMSRLPVWNKNFVRNTPRSDLAEKCLEELVLNQDLYLHPEVSVCNVSYVCYFLTFYLNVLFQQLQGSYG